MRRYLAALVAATTLVACGTANTTTPPTTTTTTSTTPTTPTTTPPPPPTTTTTPTTPTTTSTTASPTGQCEPAHAALERAGASPAEIAFAIPIALRESGCTLAAIADRPSTGDYSWGPWQINYAGAMLEPRTRLLGPPETNVASWDAAAGAFLTLLRSSGACHWQPPAYCAG